MVFKLKVIAFVLVLLDLSTFAQKSDNPFTINDIYISYNFPINQVSSTFFDNFNKYSNGNGTEFTFRNFPSIAFNIEIPNVYTFILNFEWINLKFNSNFNKHSTFSFNTFYRNFSENFEFTFLPISISFLWFPYSSDFNTSFHFQFGISIDKVIWNEYVTSELEGDPYIGLKTTVLKQLSPIFNFGIRNIFPFDLYDKEQFLQSFFFETKFCFSFRYMNIFSKISENELLKEKVAILPFSIVLLFGINLNTKSFFNN